MSSSGIEAPQQSPRRVVAAMMALVGALFFYVLVSEDVATVTENGWADVPIWLVLRYLLSMTIGGGLAGWALAGLFGRSGPGGWGLAAIGGVLAAAVAGLLGSVIGLAPDLLQDGWQTADLIPILAGLLVVPLAMAGHVLTAIGWVVLVVLTHLLARRARQPGRP